MDIRANILADTIALVTALVVLRGGMRHSRHGEDAYEKHFRSLLIVTCLLLSMDMLAWICDGQTFSWVRPLCYLTNTGYYTMQIIYCWLWTLFAYRWIHGFAKLPRGIRVLIALPLLAESALLVVNLFTGRIFLMDSSNHYRRGVDYLYNLIPFILYSLSSLLMLAHTWATSRDADRKRHCATLMVAMLMPSLGSIIESWSFGMSFTWPLAALSLLLLYLSRQQEQNAMDKAEAADAKAELAESQMSIMLSQIQPHFLYNSLTVIAELCQTDPEKAQYATMQFSAFLRGNMNSLTLNKPIAFEHELQHTKNYLALEQIRFCDRLHTVFDIQATLFHLPTLTLQPIVENAVRYGVTKRPEGGTVTICTRESRSAFTITVTDDGVGFDPLQPKEDGRTHIGLSNVRGRLKSMVGGTLEIASTPGVGTVATITIPKGELVC